MLTVITGFSPAGWELYGERMVRTFDKRWPAGVDLVVFYDEVAPFHGSKKRRITFLPYRDVPGWLEFWGRWRGEPWAKGLVETAVWRRREKENGYSYRTDAIKFTRVPMAVEWYCRTMARTEYVIWLDGDTVHYCDAPPTAEIIRRLMPGDAEVSYLGRPASYPEIGFQGYRLPAALPFLDAWIRAYSGDRFRNLHQTHSAYMFGEALASWKCGAVVKYDLTPHGTSHAWLQSPLVEWSDHLKGDERKAKGYSAEHPNKGEVSKA